VEAACAGRCWGWAACSAAGTLADQLLESSMELDTARNIEDTENTEQK